MFSLILLKYLYYILNLTSWPEKFKSFVIFIEKLCWLLVTDNVQTVSIIAGIIILWVWYMDMWKYVFKCNHLVTYSFSQQTFIKHVLCARLYLGCWGYKVENTWLLLSGIITVLLFTVTIILVEFKNKEISTKFSFKWIWLPLFPAIIGYWSWYSLKQSSNSLFFKLGWKMGISKCPISPLLVTPL